MSCRWPGLLAVFLLLMVMARPGAAQTLDLSGWDPAEVPVQSLAGPWAFHWDRATPGGSAHPVRLPHLWDRSELDGSGRPGRGQGVYTLQLLTPLDGPPLAIHLPPTFSAARLTANGVPVIVNGRPGPDAESEIREVRDVIAVLPPPAPAAPGMGVHDLVLTVSNHLHITGGPIRAPAIGTVAALTQARTVDVAVNLFIEGACIIVGLFFLTLYATGRREGGFLAFGVLCLLIAWLHGFFSGILPLFIPFLYSAKPNPYLVSVVISAFALPGTFLTLAARMFPAEADRRGVVIVLAGIAALAVGALVAMAGNIDVVMRDWATVRTVIQFVLLGALGYGLAILVRAAWRRRPGARVMLGATLVLIAGIVHDVLGIRRGDAGDPWNGIALLVMVFAFATVLGGRLNAAFAAQAELTDQLQGLNRTLEQRVRARTGALRRLAERLDRARREAVAADRAKTRFLAAANHDLRQPLHALSLIAGVLDNRIRDPDQREAVENLTLCVKATQQLLGGVLDVARLDAGAVAPEPRPCDLAGILDTVMAELGPRIQERGADVRRVNVRHGVIADGAMLTRILANLVGNALLHGVPAPGGRVLIGARRRGDRLRILVCDNGPGIAPDEQDRVFEEFHRGARPAGDADPGLGLGLAITRRFARLMGTEIDLRSVPGRGTCFAFDLARAPAVPVAPTLAAAPRITGLVILVVDDDPMGRRALADLLATWGHRPLVAEDTEGALARLAGGPVPDLMLLDGGADVAGRLDRLRRAAGGPVPAAVITGDTTRDHLDRLRALGLPILHKPVLPGNLAHLIRHLARQRATS